MPVASGRTSIVAKMQQLRQLQQMVLPAADQGLAQDSTAGGSLLQPPELPGVPAQPLSPRPAAEDEDDLEDRALLAKIQAAEKKQASMSARLEKAREELASSSRDESSAFVDTLAARAAENAAAAVRAAAAEAENSAESEAMRQIAVLELQLEHARMEVQLQKLRNSESTDAVIKRLHEEHDETLALVNAQAAEQEKAAVQRAQIEAQAMLTDALAAAQRAHEDELAQQHIRWEEEAHTRLQAAVQKVQLEADARIAEAAAAYRTGSSTSLKEETKRLKADFEERLEASKAAALVLAKEDTRRLLDEMRDEFEAEREAMETKHAEEMRKRVAAAEEHARLDAEQRHSQERSALQAEKHAAVSVARQQVEAEFGDKLVLQVQQAKWAMEDQGLAESKALAEPRLLRERKARRAAEAELQRATTYLEGKLTLVGSLFDELCHDLLLSAATRKISQERSTITVFNQSCNSRASRHYWLSEFVNTGVQGALEQQRQAAAAAATSMNAGLDRDGKEAKIEAMIARRAGALRRAAFVGFKDVVVLKKLDK